MIEIFSPGNENYQNNGDMVLTPTYCDIYAELKNTWSLEIEHPIDNLNRWKYIKEGARIRVPSFNGSQLFSIKKVQKVDSGVFATAEPIFFESAHDCFLVDVRPTNKTGQEALNIILSPNSKYSGVSNITKTSTAYYSLKNAMEAITNDENGFLKRWGGEILFDNYTIIINDKIGSNNGVSILYGKNIPVDGLSETVSIEDVVTRIVPKAYNGRLLPGNEPWVNSPLINNYPTVRTKVVEFPNIRLREDYDDGEVEEGVTICETLNDLYAALRSASNEEFEKGIDKPTVNIKVKMVLIQNTTEYKEFKDLESVSLGDTVYCQHDKLGITTEARVIGLTWDAVKESLKSVEIGEVSESFISRITSAVSSTEKALTKSGEVKAENVSGIIDGANARVIAQAQTASAKREKVMLFEDLDPNSSSYGAMALGTTGFMIADTRNATNNDWNWSTFGTGRGFNADLIKAGTLEAINIDGSVITGGTITGTSVYGSEITGGNIYLENTGALSSYEETVYGYNRSVLSNGILAFTGQTRLYDVVPVSGLASYSYSGISLKTNYIEYSPPQQPYAYINMDTSTAIYFSVGFNSNSSGFAESFNYSINSDGSLTMDKGGYRYTGYTGTIPANQGIRVVNGIIVGTA